MSMYHHGDYTLEQVSIHNMSMYHHGDYTLEQVSIHNMSMYHHGDYTLKQVSIHNMSVITMEIIPKNWYWLVTIAFTSGTSRNNFI